jgi:3-hydroxybutyryl-CoA dehydrogenase
MVFPIITPFSIRLGIAGAGTMGSGIALAALLADIPVILFDIDAGVLDRACDYIRSHLERKQKSKMYDRLATTSQLEDLAGCNLVIEAAPESLGIKIELFNQLASVCGPATILATNTSTLPVTAIAAGVPQPERVVGMHFFNPAPVLPLVEIIQGEQTGPKVLQTAVEAAQKLGKTAVIAQDRPGFIVNRVARPFYGEALRLVGERAATTQQIDEIVQLGGGFKMGPFRLMDLIGIDINLAAMQSMFEQTWGEPRYRPHWIQERMVQQNKLGRKSQQGFYAYGSNQQEIPPTQPPARGGNHGHVLVAPGTYAPGLAVALQRAGYTVEEEPSGTENALAAIIPAGRHESLRNFVSRWDSLLKPGVPLLVQACDVTVAEIATWVANPERLAGFDSLFFTNGPAATLVASPSLAHQMVEQINRFLAGLGSLVYWIQDTPGLVLPRIICMLANEAAFAVQEGVADGEKIDLAMQLGVSYPRGPLAWAKELGVQRVLSVLDHLYAEYREERYRAAQVLRRWVRTEQIQPPIEETVTRR